MELAANKQSQRQLKAAPSMIAWFALMVSLAGLGFQQYQSQLMSEKNELSIHTMLLQRNAELLKLFIEYPELRSAFYESAEIPEDPMLRARAFTIAEMWSDLFEQVAIQLPYLPADSLPAWRSYANSMYQNSPVIQAYFKQACDWYVPQLKAIWPCQSDHKLEQ